MSHTYAVLLSIPGLRESDLAHMPRLAGLGKADGATIGLRLSFPAITCPVQVSLTTGVPPSEHGVIANGFFWRDEKEREYGPVEMWTAWNDVIGVPQIWDRLHQHDAALTSAVWFPLLAKGAGADFICTPAPIHNPDGSESLWCYTKPTEMYGDLRDELGDFPLMNFWGPLSSIKSTDWIVDSAVVNAHRNQPRFSYIYLPHLDYAAQKFGPDSEEATAALGPLDVAIGRLIDGYTSAGMNDVLWIAASEYTIQPVSDVCYPNRTLREAGHLRLDTDDEGRELLNPAESRAWALCDHQVAHVFLRDARDAELVAKLFADDPHIAQVVHKGDGSEYDMDHPHAGDVILVAGPGAWFAYYWWLDHAQAPPFARMVDIHRKPGYDPVEMFIDMPTKSTPLDATLVKGSHGLAPPDGSIGGPLLISDKRVLPDGTDSLRDFDVAEVVLRNFGV